MRGDRRHHQRHEQDRPPAATGVRERRLPPLRQEPPHRRRRCAVAEEAVAFLHLDVGRHPNDRRLAALIGELSMHSDTFRTLWAAHPVQDKTHGTKHICHPVVGELELGYETLLLPGDLDQCLVVYTAPAGSPSEDRLRLLASWQTSDPSAPQTSAPRPGTN
ncbi:MmyB family transcriptional regulator [Streptomyces olivaceoviridis]